MIYCAEPDLFSDLIILLVTLTLNLAAIKNLSKNSKSKFQLYLIGYVYHIAISFYFVSNALQATNGSDSLRFYDLACGAENWGLTYGTAINFMIFATYPLNSFLSGGFLSVSIAFSTVSYIGLILIIESSNSKFQNIRDVSAIHKLIMFYLLFSPAIHFWSGGLTKESLSIFGIGIVAWAVSFDRPKYLYIFLGVLVVAHVRPYLGFIVVSAACISFFAANKKLKITTYIFVLLPMLILGSMSLEFAAQHFKIDVLSANEIEERLASSLARWGGQSYIDLTTMNPVEKIFSFMFRPLFYDARGQTMLLASVDNLLILVTLISAIFVVFRKGGQFFPRSREGLYLLGVFIVMLVLLSSTTPNLGTAARKKILVVLPLLVYLMCVIRVIYSRRKNRKIGS